MSRRSRQAKALNCVLSISVMDELSQKSLYYSQLQLKQMVTLFFIRRFDTNQQRFKMQTEKKKNYRNHLNLNKIFTDSPYLYFLFQENLKLYETYLDLF